MTLEVTDFIIVIAMTSVLTTASTTVLIYKSKQSLETAICLKIEKIHERLNKIAVRLGVVENEHESKCAVP